MVSKRKEVEKFLMYVDRSQQCQLRGYNRLLKDFHRDFLGPSYPFSLLSRRA